VNQTLNYHSVTSADGCRLNLSNLSFCLLTSILTATFTVLILSSQIVSILDAQTVGNTNSKKDIVPNEQNHKLNLPSVKFKRQVLVRSLVLHSTVIEDALNLLKH
jgi:hypothetical protein